MTLLWVLFALLHAISIGFMMAVLWRLGEYYKRYHFHESQYTLLFGFIHVRVIKFLYVVLTMTWLFISYVAFTYGR